MHRLGLVARKSVFGISEKVRFKPACSATESSYKYEISLVASLDMILSNKRITKALIRLRRCAGWYAPPKTGFLEWAQLKSVKLWHITFKIDVYVGKHINYNMN